MKRKLAALISAIAIAAAILGMSGVAPAQAYLHLDACRNAIQGGWFSSYGGFWSDNDLVTNEIWWRNNRGPVYGWTYGPYHRLDDYTLGQRYDYALGGGNWTGAWFRCSAYNDADVGLWWNDYFLNYNP